MIILINHLLTSKHLKITQENKKNKKKSMDILVIKINIIVNL
jgi:hypothetical protein